MSTNKLTRGVVNCNPANIRHGSRWIGLAMVQPDTEFCTFNDIVFGVRALIVLLRTYRFKYACFSLREVINRFAPRSENNTFAYMVYVRDFLRDYSASNGFELEVNFDTAINCWISKHRPSIFLYPLCKAICKIESDYELSEKVFECALELI